MVVKLQNIKFLVYDSTLSVKWRENPYEVTNKVRLDNDTCYHPANAENIFLLVAIGVLVAKANCGEGLNWPVEGDAVFFELSALH